MTLRNVLLCAVGLGIVAYGVIAWTHVRSQRQGAQQSTTSTQAHGEAIAHADQAQTSDTQAQQQDKALQDAEARVAELKAKLARAIRQPKGSVQPPSDPVGGDHGVSASPSQPVVDADLKDQVIQAQDQQIQGLKAQVATLTTSRDHWRAAHEAESRARAAQTMALEAQVAAAKSARWMGRFEGFAVGVTCGYVGGRL